MTNTNPQEPEEMSAGTINTSQDSQKLDKDPAEENTPPKLSNHGYIEMVKGEFAPNQKTKELSSDISLDLSRSGNNISDVKIKRKNYRSISNENEDDKHTLSKPRKKSFIKSILSQRKSDASALNLSSSFKKMIGGSITLSRSCSGDFYQSSFCRPPPSKSCMTVLTLAESIRSCDDDNIDHYSSLPNKRNLTSNTSPSKIKRSVSFSSINLREYNRSLGDNPSVLSGPPISLGWDYNEEISVPLDDYEATRPEPRTGRELLIPREIRFQMLKEYGHTKIEIRKAIKGVNIARNKRRSTVCNLKAAKMEESIEGAKRKLKKVITRKSKKEEEAELWNKARRHAAALMSHTEDMEARRRIEEEEREEITCIRRGANVPPIVITEDSCEEVLAVESAVVTAN